MHVWVRPKLHTHTRCGWRFLPHLLRKGMQLSLMKCRYFVKVLCPVRRPITTLDCFLWKDSSVVLTAGLGPEIIFWACLWVLIRLLHITICWLFIQCFIFFLVFCLETTKAGSGPTKWWTVLSVVSLSAIYFPHIPECPGTENSPTACWVEMSFSAY